MYRSKKNEMSWIDCANSQRFCFFSNVAVLLNSPSDQTLFRFLFLFYCDLTNSSYNETLSNFRGKNWSRLHTQKLTGKLITIILFFCSYKVKYALLRIAVPYSESTHDLINILLSKIIERKDQALFTLSLLRVCSILNYMLSS